MAFYSHITRRKAGYIHIERFDRTMTRLALQEKLFTLSEGWENGVLRLKISKLVIL